MMSFPEVMDDGSAVQLAEWLSTVAQKSYGRAADGFYDVASNKNLDPYPSLRDAYRANSGARFLKSAAVADEADDDVFNIADTLFKKDGFTGFLHLKNGGRAKVFKAFHANGHQYALRFTNDTEEPARCISPMMIQPYYSHELQVIEVLPLLQILWIHGTPPLEQKAHPIEDEHIPVLETVFTHFMEILGHKDTGYLLQDVAVLPDGTPIQIDPGHFHYGYGQPLEDGQLKKAIAQFHQSTRPLKIAEQFKWLTDGGQWKQDVFFVNPFKRIPYYRGFAPTA